MPRAYRRYIFFIFIGIFTVTAPLLILYTAGYRYNWERNKIQETGVLIMQYKPVTATVRLNGGVRAKKSPVRFSGLIPGRYTIAIEKEAYHAWQKRLWIEPSKTTFAEHMILWKKDIVSERVSDDALSLSAPSPNRKYIALVMRKDKSRVALFDTRTKKIIETITLPQKKEAAITNMLWSPGARRLFIESANGEQFIVALGAEQGTPIALTKFRTGRLLNVTWNTDDDDRLYGYIRTTTTKQEYELLEIDFFRGATKTASVGSLPSIFPYFVEDDLFYRVEQGVLSITSFSASKQALERRLTLPDAPTGNVTFISGGPDTVITLFDQENKRVLLIDKSTGTLYPIQETINGVVTAQWSPQKNRLLWSTGKTLTLLDLERSTREIIVEEENSAKGGQAASGGKKIQDMAWDPENEYIFYNVGDTVIVTEIDDREIRNRVPLVTTPELQRIMVNAMGNILFTQGRDGVLSANTITDR